MSDIPMIPIIPALTEPVPVACAFLEGIEIEVGETFVRIVGWVSFNTTEYNRPERRIVARAVMPTNVVRDLILGLRKAVAKGGN